MFGSHVSKELSAYCHGELAADESRGVAEHLIGCERCRKKYDEIKLGVALAAHLTPVTVPESIWEDIEAALDRKDAKSDARVRATRTVFVLGWRLAAASVALLAVIGLGIGWYSTRMSTEGWKVASIEGAPKVGSQRITDTGHLAVGEWLETDSNSRAKIDVGLIGQVEVEPNSKLKLVTAHVTEHRLALERGSMHATIWAPPRLFFVNTPSAEAVDYGCAYSLDVDHAGRSLLQVTAGWVALVLGGRESMVPAGAACETRPGIGPGTPYFVDASASLREALQRFDFEHGGSETLDIVLREAREEDALSLWYLLSRTREDDRTRVFDRLASLVPPPEGVTRDGLLQLDRKMLVQWKERIDHLNLIRKPGGLQKKLMKIPVSSRSRLLGGRV